MEDFLAFRKMITPVIIQVIFWLFVILAVVSALIMIFSGQFLMGLVILVLGPLWIRIWCEVVLVAFKMLEALEEIKHNTAPRA